MTSHRIGTRAGVGRGARRAAGAGEGVHPDGRRAGPAAPGAALGAGRQGVQFETEDGTRTLAELFDGRSQLVVYHFMFGPG